LRILVVDDGLTDAKTIDVLKELEKKDRERIEVNFKEHRHVSSTRNSGIKKCDSEHIFISDGDDTYSPKIIERLLEVLDNNRDTGSVPRTS
jgi:glycosyltransferase involved in cell wall biosynthesis